MEPEKPEMDCIQEGKAKVFFDSSSPDDVFYNPGNFVKNRTMKWNLNQSVIQVAVIQMKI